MLLRSVCQWNSAFPDRFQIVFFIFLSAAATVRTKSLPLGGRWIRRKASKTEGVKSINRNPCMNQQDRLNSLNPDRRTPVSPVPSSEGAFVLHRQFSRHTKKTRLEYQPGLRSDKARTGKKCFDVAKTYLLMVAFSASIEVSRPASTLMVRSSISRDT